MTVRQQFEVLYKVGCKKGLLAIIRNHGVALSRKQLLAQLEIAVKYAMIRHAYTLASMAGVELTKKQADQLICRCIELKWVIDAASIPRETPISEPVRKKLLQALVNHGYATSIEEAAQFLLSTE